MGVTTCAVAYQSMLPPGQARRRAVNGLDKYDLLLSWCSLSVVAPAGTSPGEAYVADVDNNEGGAQLEDE